MESLSSQVFKSLSVATSNLQSEIVVQRLENFSKRPNIRPKHLVDCLRDPVHFEFLHRFAKEPIFYFHPALFSNSMTQFNILFDSYRMSHTLTRFFALDETFDIDGKAFSF